MDFIRRAIMFFFLISTALLAAQQEGRNVWIDANYFQGNIMEHNPDILHLINGHPNGMIVAWNKKTIGSSDWQQRFNFPDYGLSFSWQDMKNEVLGHNIGLYGHANFYFLDRKLMFRVAQGIAYATNPYDKETNFRNNVYGSRFLSSTYFMLNYKMARIAGHWGANFGMSLIHYSNGNIKAPNTSTNSLVFNAGVNYDLDKTAVVRVYRDLNNRFTEPLRYNLVFRSGVNESDLVGSGQFPFYIGSFYMDKRINIKSALQLGLDVFFSDFLLEYNRYRAIAYPDEGRSGEEDYRRVGITAGHELFINKLSVLTQLGYYAYYPIVYEERFYLRLGLKWYLTKGLFGVISLKSHWAKAEAIEFGIGYRI